jgi:peptide-methionine (R)-S-oxide reductase
MDNRLDCRRKHLQAVLSPHAYWVTQKKGTERPFTNEYWWYNDVGMYSCRVCTQRLFTFDQKFKNKSGYPTFWNALKDSVRLESDNLEVPEVTNALQDPTL